MGASVARSRLSRTAATALTVSVAALMRSLTPLCASCTKRSAPAFPVILPLLEIPPLLRIVPVMIELQLERVSRDFDLPNGGSFRVLDDISVQVEAGAFVAIVGPSGCGKSTLLNIA